MKKIIFLLLIAVFDLFEGSAQTKQDSIVNVLMQQQKWFDVRDYLTQNKDSISEVFYLSAKSVLDSYSNSPDSAIMNIGTLLNLHKLDGNASLSFALLMVNNLAQIQKYNEAIDLLNDILRQVGGALPKSNIDNLNFWMSSLEFYKNYPYRVVLNEQSPTETDFEMLQNDGLGLEGKANGVKLQFIFDTGSSFNRISKETANRIGIHTYLPDTVCTNSRIRVLKGIIDSVEIGNVAIYNCPVDVSFEKQNLPINQITQENKERIINYMDSSSYKNIIGISTLKLLGIINVDFIKKKLSFEEVKSTTQYSGNLFIINNSPYLYTTLNSHPFISLFDTGSKGTFLNKEYYDRNKEHFDLKDEQLYKISAYGYDTLAIMEYKKLNDMKLNTNNHQFNLTNVMVAIKAPFIYAPDAPVPDGIIGNDFFKMLKSMRLDFKNMCFTFE